MLIFSDEDQKDVWHGKLVGQRQGNPRIEIRRHFHGCDLLIVVSTGKGYNMNPRYVETNMTSGNEVRMSMNGVMYTTPDIMNELNMVIEEAREILERL